MDCDHEGCHCRSETLIERNGGQYCSESCANASASQGEGCRCGHVGCAPTDVVRDGA